VLRRDGEHDVRHHELRPGQAPGRVDQHHQLRRQFPTSLADQSRRLRPPAAHLRTRLHTVHSCDGGYCG
jgi:hypothetical protein